MKYIITIMLIIALSSCSWIRKIDSSLNKNIHDSISVKIDTVKEYKNFNGLNKQDSLIKKNN